MLQDSGFLHLLNTTDAITDDQYKEVELIGWLYQFYISERKDEVFASFKNKKKAEAKDIPAATQIFTPNWIVKYMVQNTVGKIWLDKKPNSKIKSSLKYLVENESDSTPEPIISVVSQLTLIDPAAGSGHILVEGFDLFYQMYMEEYYTPEEAVESILKNNLFGLDLDDRAAQLANFAILLKRLRLTDTIIFKGGITCSELAARFLQRFCPELGIIDVNIGLIEMEEILNKAKQC
jgi:type II restriction/modification system DNA methylase subunit YeeA